MFPLIPFPLGEVNDSPAGVVLQACLERGYPRLQLAPGLRTPLTQKDISDQLILDGSSSMAKPGESPFFKQGR